VAKRREEPENLGKITARQRQKRIDTRVKKFVEKRRLETGKKTRKKNGAREGRWVKGREVQRAKRGWEAARPRGESPVLRGIRGKKNRVEKNPVRRKKRLDRINLFRATESRPCDVKQKSPKNLGKECDRSHGRRGDTREGVKRDTEGCQKKRRGCRFTKEKKIDHLAEAQGRGEETTGKEPEEGPRK